ncbi:Vta1 like-domain-containing protein [Infundibulicybe gibba]|nr:Vta1 like-domain-containing protein [Infundibulicybe gibba]
MAVTALLGLPPTPPDLKSIVPYLQRADELKKQDPVISYWCAYYAAQLGIALKSKDPRSRDLLFSLLGALEDTKRAIVPNDAIDIEAASAAYLENFALKVFASADNEDRKGVATRATAKKFVAAANFLEVLKVFVNIDIPEANIEKIKYAKWKAADIAKAFREGRQPTPGSTLDPSPPPPQQPSPPPSTYPYPTTQISPTRTTPSPPHLKRISPPPVIDHANILRANLHRPHLHDGTPDSWSTAATPGTGVIDDLGPSPGFGWEDKGKKRDHGFEIEPGVARKNRSGSGSSTGSTGTLGKKVRFTPSTIDAPPEEFHPEPLLPTAPPLLPSPPPPPHVPLHAYEAPHPHPPSHYAPLPPPPPPPPAEIALTPAVIAKAQKHCRFAISALDYEDAEQARKELRAALLTLGG